MANITQIQRGFTLFVDNEVAPAFDGWKKAVVAGGAGLIASNMPNLVKVYGAHPIVAALGVYDPASGNINIDALHKALTAKLGTEKIPVTIPKLGTIRLGKDELDLLARYIKEA